MFTLQQQLKKKIQNKIVKSEFIQLPKYSLIVGFGHTQCQKKTLMKCSIELNVCVRVCVRVCEREREREV